MHGKSPTLKQKKYLDTHGYCSGSWLITKDTTEFMEIKHRKNGRVERLNKYGKPAFEIEPEEVKPALWWMDKEGQAG